MTTEEKIQKALALSVERAKSRGFTREYQDQKEFKDNIISLQELAPATAKKYDDVVFIWGLWRLSRNEPVQKNFSKDEPDPTPQQLKLFAEHYITTRRELPSKKTTCGSLISLISHWERTTYRSLDRKVKTDVLNFIRNDLTKQYGLRTKPRERFPVTAKDIDYLLHYLFNRDYHDFKHERARVQTASSLSLFAGSGSRAGAVVESSSYRNSNECLYYRHMKFQIKWGNDGELIRWVTIDSEFLKGHRYNDDIDMPKNWFRGHPVLGKNFVFWVIVHGVADGAFKGLTTVEKVLSITPPQGRESWTLEWDADAKDLPFFRAVTPNGPEATKALSFSSLHHNNKSLAKRDGFKDNLRVHGIRGAVANKIDPKASEATRGQALDHQDHNTYLKYQALLKALDIGALYNDLEPDYECRDMEQSMSHHRDTNAPQKLNAATFTQFHEREDIIEIEKAVSDLTHQIDGKPQDHKDLTIQRSKLYGIKAKRLQKWKDECVKRWWDISYDEYIAGNDFSERDSTPLFDIYKKYVPERARLSENLFQEASLDSKLGKQCLSDLVTICTSTERVAYYPNMSPKEGQCPTCAKVISEVGPNIFYSVNENP
ncbi:uncharacterized protein N7484_007017 [Penicillium longicatenatum]|uniref:uncharacterized protein n=1 Tax=Penicillium longicatenatum TaxID=1561947 RepID=UPI002548EEEF|nr:uncharacterized protein N7484_007017 [Penicillium longicatenatum]KAJ5639155.1 hypothetical protein N7484_007017 [Penicillium longicatenatum]